MKNIDRVRQLASEGKSTKEICLITGLTFSYVNHCRSGANTTALKEENVNSKMTQKQQEEWMIAVNRLRRYYGKEPLPMPEFRAQVPGR